MKEFDVADSRPLVVKAQEKKNNAVLELPITLGKPRPKSKEYKDCMAMDSCIKNVFSGFRTDTLFSTMPMFVGYGMLSNISQEALIRAGVETVADEMTRKFVKFTYHKDDGNNDKEEDLSYLDEQAIRYKLKERFNEAMLKDGYFGGCLIYIDVGDLDDEEKEEPLVLSSKTFKKGSLKGFKVIEPVNIYPGWYNTNDPTDEYYFKPKYWYILGKKYHESRFLYIAGNEAPLLLKPTYNFFGIPQAQLALDYVAHFVANREAAQELLNKFSLTCWKTNMTQALKGKGCNDLVSRVKMFNRLKNNNGTMVLDKETEDMMQINTPLSGVRDIVEMSLNLLTAVWRIPKIKYIGEGEGGLNASSKEQMRSFYDYILSQQEKIFTHPMEKVLKIFQLNAGKEPNDAISFEFPSLVEMDDKERADLNKLQADRDAIYLANGVISQEEVRQRLSMDKHSEYSMIDVDEVPEVQEEPLKEVDEVQENETVRRAMDMAMDSFEGHQGRPGMVGGSLPKKEDSTKKEKIFIGHKLALQDLQKEAKKESSILGVVKKLKENNDIAQFGEFAKGNESAVVWYWYNGGKKLQPTKEDVDKLVQENYAGFGDYKTFEEIPSEVKYKFSLNEITMDEFVESEHPRDKNGKFVEKVKNLLFSFSKKDDSEKKINNKYIKNFLKKKNYKIINGELSQYNPNTDEIILNKNYSKKSLVHEQLHSMDYHKGNLSRGLKNLLKNEILTSDYIKKYYEIEKNKPLDLSEFDSVVDVFDYEKNVIKPEAYAYYFITSRLLEKPDIESMEVIQDIFDNAFEMTINNSKENTHNIDYLALGDEYRDSEIFAQLGTLLEIDEKNYTKLKTVIPKTMEKFEKIIKL